MFNEFDEIMPPYSIVFSRKEAMILRILFKKHMTSREQRGEAWVEWDKIIKKMDNDIDEKESRYHEDLNKW